MTNNQIAYWKYIEEKMQNLRQYTQNQYALEESKRHNLESELIGLQQAAAAQTSAAAAYKQALTRQKEYEETVWVDQKVQTRNDLLASYDVTIKQAEAGRLQSQANLYNAQAETEARRADLVTAQTTLADTQAIAALAGVGSDYLNAITKVVATIAALS